MYSQVNIFAHWNCCHSYERQTVRMSYQPTATFSSQSTPLSSSVASLQSSLSLLTSSINILDAGTKDLPRLSKTLTQTRHFELTPAFKLTQAQESLASELEPAIEKLLARVETECERLERREEGYRARSELLAGRLEGAKFGRNESAGGSSGSAVRTSLIQGGGNGNGEMALRYDNRSSNSTKWLNWSRLKMLKQKKERLNYAVERLTLQSQQRQRQLRMSVNVPRLEDDD